MQATEQTRTQQRVALVLTRMLAQVAASANYAEAYSPHLEEMLDELHGDDGFGTEGQCDPRGDYRNGQWFMERVEGIDTRVKQSKDATTQQRVNVVLYRIGALVREDEHNAEMFSDALEDMLSAMQGEACFGADSQDDPRGNFTAGSWSMTNVQDIDAG